MEGLLVVLLVVLSCSARSAGDALNTRRQTFIELVVWFEKSTGVRLTRTPGGEAPHTASSARGGGAQAMPSLSKLCPQAMPSLTKLCPSWVGSGSWRRSLGGGGYPIGEAAPGSSTSESDSNCALGMVGMLSRRTSLGSMASRCDERAADIGRATVIAAGAALAGSSLGRTRLLDHRTRSMAAGTAAG